MDLSALSKQTSVTLIDDSSILIGTVAVGDDPCQIALDLANSRAYVTNAGSDDVSVIDTDLLVEVARISLDESDIATALDDGRDPCGIDVGTFNGASFVVVGNYDSNNLSVINATTLNVVATFP
jgi:YVTN family beta-propeller protein